MPNRKLKEENGKNRNLMKNGKKKVELLNNIRSI